MTTALSIRQDQITDQPDNHFYKTAFATWMHTLRHKPNTKRAYQTAINQFGKFLGKHPLSAEVYDIQSWEVALEGRNMKPATVALKLAAVKSLMSYVSSVYHQAFSFNPGAAIKLPRVQSESLDKWLPLDDVLHMIETTTPKRDRDIMAMLFYLGLRASELTGLKVSDIKPVDSQSIACELRVLRKGGRYQDLAVPVWLWPCIDPVGRTEGALFPSRKKGGHLSSTQVYRIVVKHAKRCGHEGFTTHSLRHCHGAHASDAGAPLSEISQQFNHADEKTTLIYTRKNRRLKTTADYLDRADFLREKEDNEHC